MEVPDTPISQQAANQMQSSVSRFGPEMEKFFYGMMQNGGAQNIDNLMKNIQERGQQNQQDIRAQVLSQDLPRGSTAQARALGGELSDAALERNIQMGNIRRQMEQQAMQRQFQGAQGLSQMPQFYQQPSAVEQQMFSMQTPYRMQNMQNQMEQRLANLRARQSTQRAKAGLMGEIGTYQPERIQQPSGFQKYVSPLLKAGTSIASAALMGGA